MLTSEGYYDPSAGRYYYYLKDHLGNTRLTFHYSGTTAVVDQEVEYYPFGMALKIAGSSDNKYLYNGKELQDDAIGNGTLDWYDYGARMYDAALGRFHTVDPLSEKYNFQSTYAYAANNPMKYIDFMGMKPDSANTQTNPALNDFLMRLFNGTHSSQTFTFGDNGASPYVTQSASEQEGQNGPADLNFELFNNVNTSLSFTLGAAGYNIGQTLGAGSNLSRFKPLTSGSGSITSFPTNSGWRYLGLDGAKALKLGGVFRMGGNILGGIGLFSTAYQMITKQISAKEGGTDMGAGVTGFFGIMGMSFSGVYFGMKAMGQFDPVFLNAVEQQNKQYQRSLIQGTRSGTQYYMNMSPVCFKAGTKIVYNDDSLRDIEKVCIGDTVRTFNLKTSMVENSVVSNTIIRSTSEIYKLTFGSETVYVTAEHPFYVKNQGWVKVCNLRVGQLLITSDEGKTPEIEMIEKLNEKMTVYNITVEGNHNYFVGNQEVLVHNK
ncbi:polymorphic toxin-type HINT domain-containing protein [Prolixibacter bellariivorans]|uniref:polymorphic toxin-type HINT domain-containing protein n=1 Tax=Prolixibacter bellariivorans TaxID=314319 RepID=UPI0021D0ECD3|nr:polymorphic toxin-type HINT domain-containing protein [Prolixibacter bellariivorans]